MLFVSRRLHIQLRIARSIATHPINHVTALFHWCVSFFQKFNMYTNCFGISSGPWSALVSRIGETNKVDITMYFNSDIVFECMFFQHHQTNKKSNNPASFGTNNWCFQKSTKTKMTAVARSIDSIFRAGKSLLTNSFVPEYSYWLTILYRNTFHWNILPDWICSGISSWAEYFVLEYPYLPSTWYWNILADWMFCAGKSLLTNSFVPEYP